MAGGQSIHCKGKKTDRPDLVVFLNGLPISIIELKNPADETADVSKAFNQIKNYQNEISQLFEPSAVNIISDGTVARIGSITANSERFMPWRVASGIEDPAKHLELEVMIRGVFEKRLSSPTCVISSCFRRSAGAPSKLQQVITNSMAS